MSVYSNLHTHTTYCDGKHTPLEMAEAAYKKGFRSLGFSGHAYTPFDESYCMSEEATKAYQKEIRLLGDRFAGTLDIFLGIENDGAAPQGTEEYDFVIGSMHYIFVNGRYYGVDESPQILRQCIEEGFAGNSLRMTEAYYEALLAYVQTGKMDIVGHVDLIEKFNSHNAFFDSSSPTYRNIALGAIEEIAKSGKIVEVNTGAMARGYTKTPYPASFLIKRLVELKAPLILSADAHDKNGIDAYFKETLALLQALGVKELMELRKGEGFVGVPLSL